MSKVLACWGYFYNIVKSKANLKHIYIYKRPDTKHAQVIRLVNLFVQKLNIEFSTHRLQSQYMYAKLILV